MSYRVGVVGAGRGMGPAAMFDLMPGFRLTAACDPDTAALNRVGAEYPDVARFADYGAMLDSGLDVVVVGTPIPLHAEQTIAALEAGCHVLQEVTLSNTMEGCRAIAEAVARHPRQKFMLAENCCYWGHILAWHKMWRDGQLGEFLYGEAEYVHDIRSLLRGPDGKPTWRAARPPIVYCTHSLGPILKVTGERIVSACCLGTEPRLEPELAHRDFMVAIFRTTSGGAIKLLRAQAVVREPPFHYYSLYGTKGCLETTRPPISPLHTNAYLEDIPHLTTMLEIPVGENVPGVPAAALGGGHGTIEYLMVQDFCRAVAEDLPSPIGIQAALDMTLPGLCAYESALQCGAPVEVPDWSDLARMRDEG